MAEASEPSGTDLTNGGPTRPPAQKSETSSVGHGENRQSRAGAGSAQSQNYARYSHSGSNSKARGNRPRQTRRRMGADLGTKGRQSRQKTRPEKDVKSPTPSGTDVAGEKGNEFKFKEQATVTFNDKQTDKHFRHSYPKKFGKKEGLRNVPADNTPSLYHASSTSASCDFQPERFPRSVGKPRINNHQNGKHKSGEGTAFKSQKGIKGHSDLSKQHQDFEQAIYGSGNKMRHGTVNNDSVYVRRDKQMQFHSGYKMKQLTANNMASQNDVEVHVEKVFATAKPPRDYSKKPTQSMQHAGKIPARLKETKFDKDGQSSVQATVLIEQLTDEKYECMVCCEVVRCAKAVWCCSSCYHIFHLFCIKRWARSPTALVEDSEGKTTGWRCPACQFVERNVPNAYRCFCGKVEGPKWYPHDGITPHSCGELCLKKRVGKNCPHPCNQLCHPGPCPSCPVTINKKCCCGKTAISVRCGNSSNVTCSSVCGKTLNCGLHVCQENCHTGQCEPCSAVQDQSCYCGKSKREASCGSGSPTYINGKPGYFSCDAVCSKKLDCGNHECVQVCHPSECPRCMLQPQFVTHCPCGKEKLVDLLNGSNRKSCVDPIPTCGNSCDRLLPCAKYNDMTKASSEHRCTKICHFGDCSTCEGDSIIKCRCRATSKKLLCSELILMDESFLCELRCNKKLHCGRHRCNQKCCPGMEHICRLTCGKRLKCGKHKCLEPCHSGTCPPCLMAGFDEVFCPCGATVQEPPIPCGKPPPVCNRPCARMHPCQHEVDHNCHYEEQCPPCTVLVSKWCMGEHKLRHNIPCHIESVSCGEQCCKPLPCGRHKCLKTCHKGPCLEENEQCKQLCTAPRESCGHPCDSFCHDGECPDIPCKSKIRISCKCGRKSEDSVCLKGGDKLEAAQAYQRFTTKNLAQKIKGLQGGQTVDISGLMNLDEKRSQLDCDEECAMEQRNRILAEALGISQSDFTSRTDPAQFPHFLEEHGRANMKFLHSVEDTFENLVKAVAKSQSLKLSHSFGPMNNKNRRFIHEMATCYGCSSVSYDQEPNRNTVITATKELSRCPRVKLSSHIQRQMNPQPPPPPVPVLPEEGRGNVKFVPRKPQETDGIDYFEDDS